MTADIVGCGGGVGSLVDPDQTPKFFDAVFRYADPSSYVALRVFPQQKGDRTLWSADVPAGNSLALASAAERAAIYSADTTEPSVFAPAICTFARAGTAKTRDIANGLALIIELDQGDTGAALDRIEGLIGAATVVVLSGGTWSDPATGEVHPKRHVYWRLSEATYTEAEHALLYSARRDAAVLTGADPTGKPVVHCYRWPGSVNRKNPAAPATCRIERINPEAEIHLGEAAELLAEAAELLAEATDGMGMPRRATKGNGTYHGKRELAADEALVAAAMAVIPNVDVHYDEWIRMGYAACGATAGAGYAVWRDWSAQSAKHNEVETEAAWARIRAAGVTRIGAGTIFAEARRYGWIDPRRPNGQDHQAGEAASDGVTTDAGDDLEAAITRLALLSPVQYERVRQDEAKRLKVRIGFLDRVVRQARGTPDDQQGRPLDLPLPDPWPEPVDGSVLLQEITSYFAEHAVLPEHGATLLALWAIHTHCYTVWRYTPRLHVSAATKRAGKSRVLRLLKLLVCKPLPSENITPAAVFRSVAAVHPTLLIDEADVSLRDNPELVSILNGGHEQGGAAVRTVGENHEPRQFDTFAPVAIAGIGRLPGTLEDRSVKLPMRRALRSEQPAKITPATEAAAERLLRQIARWTADHKAQLCDAKPDMAGLVNRIEDNWTPLYAIAATAGADLLDAARQAMAGLTPDEDDADSLGEQLLHDMREVFNAWIVENAGTTQHEMTSAAIVERLLAMEERPWPEMGRARKPLTQNMLARLLRPFRVRPGDIGPEGKRQKGYRLLAFADAFARHLAPLTPSKG